MRDAGPGMRESAGFPEIGVPTWDLRLGAEAYSEIGPSRFRRGGGAPIVGVGRRRREDEIDRRDLGASQRVIAFPDGGRIEPFS